METIVRIDLNKVYSNLGHKHLDQAEVQAQCDNCAELGSITFLTQEMNICPGCGAHVVWFHSKIWTALYGSAQQRINELSIIPPSDEAGIMLCDLARVRGFRTKTNAETWAKGVKQLGLERMKSIAAFAAKDKSGRAATAHALNIVKKELRERKRSPKKPRETESRVLV